MTGEFEVDLPHLDEVVTKLANLTTYLTDHLATLDQKVATLHTGSWTGTAAEAHHRAHTEWSKAAQTFTTGVSNMTTAAHNAHTHYTNAITANTTMFGGH
ncbi:WXG100 family type VII secretion target [Nocardia sp. NPDC088792]|uniref:WXG100 family type VII secretion target n=1 Tax=Nocardia sp. NPDC088792 TaxID=3364332 RepID=UPI0038174251